LTGWMSTCGTAPSCPVPDGTDGGATATFAGPGAKAVALTLVAPVEGVFVIADRESAFPTTICIGSCTPHVPPRAALDVYALSVSAFAGWTGACAGADQRCALDVTANVATTVTFARDDREIATLLPSVPTGVIAFAPDDDLVTAGAQTVSKLGLDG